MLRRTRYQQGSVQREKRQSGPDVWVFRWWETGTDGANKRRKAILGTVTSLPTETLALQASRALRIDANQQTPQLEGKPSTMADLVGHYRLKELSGEVRSRKAFSTRSGYECYLKNWILPRWGNVRLDQVKPVAVEEWLDSIKRARATRAKIRNLMSAIFQHAMRYEWVERNPIRLVRQSAKRERTPDVLELTDIQLLLSKLEDRERTLVLLDAATGLRVSELLALRWEDVDFELASGCGRVQDGSFSEACPSRRLHGRGSPSLAPGQPLPDEQRLGLCQPDHERQAAVLAGQSDEAVHPAGCESKRHFQEYRLAHLPPYLRNTPEGEWRRCEDRSGAFATCEQSNHSGRVCPGGERDEARSAEQGCEDDDSGRGSKGQRKIPASVCLTGLLYPYCTRILLSL